jgi:hypothetical protein
METFGGCLAEPAESRANLVRRPRLHDFDRLPIEPAQVGPGVVEQDEGSRNVNHEAALAFSGA